MADDVCRLCGRTAELRASHLIPKFVFDWMKRTGTPHLRRSGSPNVRRQDGPRHRWLCDECEQRFSTRERWFAQHIFVPFLGHRAAAFQYDESLFYFLLSVLWRVLQDGIEHLPPDHRHRVRTQLAEHEWRTYLLGGRTPLMCGEVHLLLTDLGTPDTPNPVVNFNRYLTRAVDYTIGSSDTRCFAYAKFARFVAIGGISGLDPSLLVGTRVVPATGTLLVPQEMRDGLIGEFMLDRARSAHAMTVKGTSPTQQQVITDAFRRDAAHILAGDLGQVLRADYEAAVDPKALWPAPGADDDCTCGSGKTFEQCHGRGG